MKIISLCISLLIGLGIQAQELTGYAKKDAKTQLELEENFRSTIDSSSLKNI